MRCGSDQYGNDNNPYILDKISIPVKLPECLKPGSQKRRQIIEQAIPYLIVKNKCQRQSKRQVEPEQAGNRVTVQAFELHSQKVLEIRGKAADDEPCQGKPSCWEVSQR